MSEKHTLLLVDGLSMVRRIYEAIPGDHTQERVDACLKGSFRSVLRALREFQPTHFLVAFDSPGPTWRHDVFAQYKANREPMPEILRTNLKEFFGTMSIEGLKSVVVPNEEADDVLASVALKAVQRGFRTIVLSTDKDLCQLIHHGVELRDHFNEEWRDENWVSEKMGVPSRLVGHYLALMGDRVDGIPGVTGVGKKTAAKLLNQYGSLHAVLDTAEKIPGKLGTRLRDEKEMALLSWQLVELKKNIQIGITPNEMLVPSDLLQEKHESKARMPHP